MSRFDRITALVLLLIVTLIVFFAIGFYDGLRVVHYTVEAESIDQRVRLALVTDLHSESWGQGQKTLLKALDAASPDAVLLGGDMFSDDNEDDNTEAFLAGIYGRYPCWYVTGNHEYTGGKKARKRRMAMLDNYGVHRFANSAETLVLNGQSLTLCGVNDLRARGENIYISRVKAAREAAGSQYFTILLAHRPEYIDLYSQCGFDLVLAGHTHGGLWRIPGLVNGIYSSNQGLFPRYAGGRYEVSGTTMIVSRGLSRKTEGIPRFYNRPELVIVDIE